MTRDLIPEEARSRELRYYYAHRAERIAYRAEYARQHPRSKEEEAFRVRKYRATHPEKAEARRAYQREYYRTHREARLAYQKSYRQRKKSPASVTAEAGKERGDAERNV